VAGILFPVLVKLLPAISVHPEIVASEIVFPSPLWIMLQVKHDQLSPEGFVMEAKLW
jgi:hypothetical protein